MKGHAVSPVDRGNMEEIMRKKGHAVSLVDRGNMEEIMRKEGTQGRGVSKIKRS